MRLECALAEIHDSIEGMELFCTPREFEAALKLLFERKGFSVELTKASGDGGIDLHVVSPVPIVGGRYIVQAKRYKDSVGEPVLRDLYGTLIHERAMKAILITSGYFTKSALAFAEGKPIELIDGEALQVLIDQMGLHGAFSLEAKAPDIVEIPPSSLPQLPAANKEAASPPSPLESSQPNLPQDKISGFSSLVVVIMSCLAVACLYSSYRQPKKTSESMPIEAPIKPRETPQQTSTPAPEIKATEPPATPAIALKPTPEPFATLPTPVVASTPLPPPTASPDAQARAVQKYPELSVAGSLLHRVFWQKMEFYRDHDPIFFNDAEWPTKLADVCAKLCGEKPRPASPSVRPKPRE